MQQQACRGGGGGGMGARRGNGVQVGVQRLLASLNIDVGCCLSNTIVALSAIIGKVWSA